MQIEYLAILLCTESVVLTGVRSFESGRLVDSYKVFTSFFHLLSGVSSPLFTTTTHIHNLSTDNYSILIVCSLNFFYFHE